ncbi:MAG: hypothetical protein EAZ44_10040 [Cytophagia bacterium]|nr:MAG: hypothetical protein EAY69_02270 [Cytophagales bacterium]TAF99680.1 MAG: hypothetical protein EAZ44_10040 [Cytophagia bacterium]TAG41090.1 MAG: hypothetical protein EAZ31_07865 [Cytophagia bacterium]TAH29389.1 MAG: hypothetical protein EAZ06_07010 [Cytophagales bacterium]
MKNFALLVAAIFHPLLLPSYGFGVLFFGTKLTIFPTSYEIKWRLWIILFVMTFLIPFVCILIFYLMKGIKSLMISDKEERINPFLLTTFLYSFFTFFFLTNENLIHFPAIGIILLGISLSLASLTLITLYWKISAHSIGMSGLLGGFFAIQIIYHTDLLFLFFLLIVLTGLVMSARLYVAAHTPSQVWAGAGLGFFINFFVVLSLLFFR